MTYREGVPVAQSPCSVPASGPVGWYVEQRFPFYEGRSDERGTKWVQGTIVWTTYAVQARALGAQKLKVLDPSTLIVRRIP